MRDPREDIALQMLGMEIGLARLASSILEAPPRSAQGAPARHAPMARRLRRSHPRRSPIPQRLLRTGQ